MSRILLVEDDPSLGATLSERLSEEGHALHWARSRAEAIQILGQQPIDLCLLDIGLPDGSGLTIAREVKSRGDTAVIFLTAMNSAEYRLEGFEIGADDYIPKPFHFKELKLRIERVLQKYLGLQLLQSGNITLDLARRVVLLPDATEDVPASRDFDLLRLLIESTPRVVSRDEIYKRLWSRDDERSSLRTIDNVILRLRTMLKRGGLEPIRSVRGVGYQWIYDNRG